MAYEVTGGCKRENSQANMMNEPKRKLRKVSGCFLVNNNDGEVS